MKKILTLIACITVPLALGAWAGIVTSRNIAAWFETLIHPSFRPPNWLFGPVWTSLYILMGISFFLILESKSSHSKKVAIRYTLLQMLLNTMWSFLFFYFHQLGTSLVEIILLWLCILLMIRAYYPIHKIAAYLQIPYLAWVSFASILNAAYYFLN
jgi:tryptophan-rich sensory protein